MYIQKSYFYDPSVQPLQLHPNIDLEHGKTTNGALKVFYFLFVRCCCKVLWLSSRKWMFCNNLFDILQRYVTKHLIIAF